MLLLSSADFVQIQLTFSKRSFRNTIRVSNGLDPDQDRCSVDPHLGLNCLQRFSADDKVAASRQELEGERNCSHVEVIRLKKGLMRFHSIMLCSI